MRIAMACEGFAPGSGGAAHWSRQVARGLADRGHEVVVLTFAAPTRGAGADGGAEHGAGCDDAGLEVRRLAWHPGRLARARAISSAVRQERTDVVHDTGAGWSFDVFHPQTGPRLLNYRRDMASRTPRERLRERLRPRHWRWLHELRRVERRQFSQGDALFVAVSTMVARAMERLHGVSTGAVRLVPNGIDVRLPPPPARARLREEQRRRLGLDRDETLFLFPAHNLRLKGARPLVEVAALLRARGARFRVAVIGGDADDDLSRRIGTLALDEAILRLGFVPDPTACFAAADALVLPTFHDACSLSVFEALAWGLPVITTRHNGAAEHLADGRDGFVLDDPRDAHGLADRMLALGDAELRGRMSAAASGQAARHGLARNLDALEGVLYEAAERRSRRRRDGQGATS